MADQKIVYPIVQPSSDLRSTCLAVAASMYAQILPPESEELALARAKKIATVATSLLDLLSKK